MKLPKLVGATSLALVALTACPQKQVGEPSLTVALSTPSPVSGQTFTAHVVAANGDDSVGAGTVHLTATAGSLAGAGVDATLDSFGTATVELSCDLAVDPNCGMQATVTANWIPAATGALVRATTHFTTVPPAGGGNDAGSVVCTVMPDVEPDSGCPHRKQSCTTSVTYQINQTHTGWQPSDQLTLPLCKRWSHDLGGQVGYPVVAEGKVFVTSRLPTSAYGTNLWALDALTGAVVWGPVMMQHTYFWSALAYDNGRVFSVNADAVLSAFNAATGAPLWSGTLPGQYSADSAPTALNGWVYASASGSGGTVYGVAAATGSVKWTASVQNGDTSSPAVTSNGVFVSYACNQAYRFSPTQGDDGGIGWYHPGPCEGGGGKTVAVFNNQVFTRDGPTLADNLVLNASNGTEQGNYLSQYIPAFDTATAYYTPKGQLHAFTGTVAGTEKWAFKDGSGTLVTTVTAPIVVGANVVTADATTLYVLSAADGTVVSSTPLTVNGPDEQNVTAPLAGLSEADGLLFAPAGTSLVAF